MDYLRAGFVIAPQLFAGCLIYLLILKRSEVAVVELLSIGFVIGITTSTICDQIFVNLSWLKIGWLLPLLISTIIGSFVIWTKKIKVAKVAWRGEFKNSFFPIIAIATTALGTEWFWLFPSGVFLVISAALMYFPRIRFQRIMVRISLLASAVAMFYMISTRPKIWWMLEEVEYPFFEALSSSVANWGIQDYVLNSGTDVKYHWFTYAWVGLVDRATNAENFRISTEVAPVAFAIAITGLVWSLVNRKSISQKRTFFFSLLSMAASSYPIWGGGMKLIMLSSPSQFFAFTLSIATIFLLIESSEDKIRLSPFLIGIMAGATVLSKVFHGAILALLAISLVLVFGVYSRKISKLMLLNSLIVITSTAFIFLRFIFVENSQHSFKFAPGDFIWQLQGELRSFPNIYVRTFGLMAIFSLAVLPISLLALIKSGDENVFRSSYFVMSMGSIAGGIFLASATIAGDGENLYFLHSSVILSSVLSFSQLSEKQNLPKISTKAIIYASAFGACLALTSYAIPNFDSGSKISVVLRTLKTIAPAWMLIIALVVTRFVVNKNRKPKSRYFCVIALVSSTMCLAYTLVNWIDFAPQKTDEFRRNGSLYLAQPDLKEVSSWINLNTNQDDIVASNFGWPSMDVADLETFSQPCIAYKSKEVLNETCKRTKNTLLVAYTKRRFWLQATVLQYSEFDNEIKQRQLVSVGFASNPIERYVSIMKLGGVDWFVVDRSTTSLKSWLPFAEIKYSNDSFFVLKI